jgi:hypothetical protein
MAQNTWSLPTDPNDSFFDARLQYNNAINNLATNHSGAAAPTIIHDRMWWYDTATNKVKLENGAGGWLVLLDGAANGGMLRHDGANAMTGDLDLDNNALLDPFNDTTTSVGALTGRLKFKIGTTTYACKYYALT